MTRPKALQDRGVELGLAALLFAASAWLVHDAFENRGKSRPFWTRIAPLP